MQESDYVGHTTLNPVSLSVLIALSIAMFLVPRRWAVVPVILIACFIAPAQRVVVGALNFSFLRIIVIAGLARVFARRETVQFKWRTLDTLTTLFVISVTIVYTIREGTSEAFINRLGEGLDLLGPYFFFRFVFRDWGDVAWMTRAFAAVSIPIGIVFMIEKATGRNMFAVLGGVPEITVVREGTLRCQGAFAHSILAGCFWASLAPLFAGLFLADKRSRWLTGTAVAMCLWIVVACASSTPAAGIIVGMLGGAAYFIRPWMRTLRWSTVAVLVGLHVSMKAPVWNLIARTNIVGGSEGWHRYHLINECINNFGSWWLLGTSDTAAWADDLYDVTNEFILWGVRGGFVSMVLFISIIVIGFRGVGRIVRGAESSEPVRIFGWAVGVCLMVHCASFIGVSYFGQIHVIWWMTLAIIGSLEPMKQRARRMATRGAQPGHGEPVALLKLPAVAPAQAVVGSDQGSPG